MKNTALDAVALTLSIIGAVNWGLIGLFKFDLVAFLFGSMTLLSRIIYTIVGICGIYLISFYAKKARGLMSRYIIQNRLTKPEQLTGFNSEGYFFDEEASGKGELVFKRHEQ